MGEAFIDQEKFLVIIASVLSFKKVYFISLYQIKKLLLLVIVAALGGVAVCDIYDIRIVGVI